MTDYYIDPNTLRTGFVLGLVEYNDGSLSPRLVCRDGWKSSTSATSLLHTWSPESPRIVTLLHQKNECTERWRECDPSEVRIGWYVRRIHKEDRSEVRGVVGKIDPPNIIGDGVRLSSKSGTYLWLKTYSKDWTLWTTSPAPDTIKKFVEDYALDDAAFKRLRTLVKESS